jgi:hypothetical protein
MLEAYFDESGTHTGPLRTRQLVMCVAGYVFTASRAKRFNEGWNSALEQAGIVYFRMSECYSGRGQFEGWPKLHCKRYARKMATLIRDHMSHDVGVWLTPTEFERLTPDVPPGS